MLQKYILDSTETSSEFLHDRQNVTTCFNEIEPSMTTRLGDIYSILEYAEDLQKHGDGAGAVEILEQCRVRLMARADPQEVLVLAELAEIFADGCAGVAKNAARAEQLFLRGVALDDYDTVTRYASRLANGDGLTRNTASALKLLEKAVTIQDELIGSDFPTIALREMADILEFGRDDFAADPLRASRVLQRLHEEEGFDGEGTWSVRLAKLLLSGTRNLQKDEKRAMRILLEGNARGNADATFHLGIAILSGIGGQEPNTMVAIECFDEATKQDRSHIDAKRRLADLLLQVYGQDTPEGTRAVKLRNEADAISSPVLRWIVND